jgi:hypothetical protein
MLTVAELVLGLGGRGDEQRRRPANPLAPKASVTCSWFVTDSFAFLYRPPLVLENPRQPNPGQFGVRLAVQAHGDDAVTCHRETASVRSTPKGV